MPSGGPRPGFGGKQPGSGRPKGSKNKQSIRTREELWAYIWAQGPEANPFTRMVDRMLTTTDPQIEMQCMVALADRLLPKLKAVEVSTNIDNLAQALALLRALPDAALAQLEHPGGEPLGLPHETA